MNYTSTYKGKFWIKDEDANTKFGVLKFSNGIAYIDQFGAFDKWESYRQSVDCILGYLDNGYFCIFRKCTISKDPFGSVLINFHFFIHAPKSFFKDRKLEFTGVNFRMDYLSMWSRIDIFESFLEEEVIGVKRRKIDLEKLYLLKDQDYNIKLTHHSSVPLTGSYADYNLEQESWLWCDIKSQIDFPELFMFLSEIEEIFTILIGSKTSIISPLHLSVGNEYNFFCHRNIRDIKFDTITKTDPNSTRTEPLLDYISLQEQIDVNSFFKNWRKMRPKYDYVISKVTEVLSRSSNNLESDFLNLVFALEKLQEIDSKGLISSKSISSKDEHHIKVLLDYGVNKNTVEYFRARLTKKNQARLKEKLSTYLAPFQNWIETFLYDDYSSFISKLVDSRNHLAHLCGNCEHKIVGREYPDFNKQIVMVLLTIVFSKLGLDPTIIAKKLKHHPDFSFSKRIHD